MDRKRWNIKITWFAKQNVRSGLVVMMLAAMLAGSGCGKNREEKEPQQTLDQVEMESPDDSEDTSQPSEGKENVEDKEEKGNEEKNEEIEKEGDTNNSEDSKDPEESEDSTEERLTIERIGEPISFEAEDGTQLFISSLYYPLVSIPENPAAAEKINQIFETQKAEDEVKIDEYKEWAEQAYEEQKEQVENTFLNYALDRDYIVTYFGERILCINEIEYSYAGGTHPSSQVVIWNFDLATGDLINWEQMTDDMEGFRSFLLEKINAFVETEQMADGVTWSEALYPNYQDTLPTLLEHPNWYVEEGNLILIFNPYDIAPYAAGSIVVNIPLADCEDYWNEYGKELLQADNY